MEQELLTPLKNLSSPPVYYGVHVALSLVFCIVFCRSLFVLFLLAIVLSALLWLMVSGYPFGIFKHFFLLKLLTFSHDIKFKQTLYIIYWGYWCLKPLPLYLSLFILRLYQVHLTTRGNQNNNINADSHWIT